jgi:hypothetical protein
MNDQPDSPPGETDHLDPSALPFNQTEIVPGGTNRVKRTLEEADNVDQAAVVHNMHSIRLVVRGITEPLPFHPEKTSLVVGRSDHRSAMVPDVDLTHLGAGERGVSRRHARLEVKDQYLYITDLDSSNGSFVRGKQLTPYLPVRLSRRDEVRLGRLVMVIVFD